MHGEYTMVRSSGGDSSTQLSLLSADETSPKPPEAGRCSCERAHHGVSLCGLALLVALILVGLVAADPAAAGPHNARCQRALAMKIVSHCGRSGSPNETAVVSEGSVLELHQRGITSFDMDLFWTTDNQLYVGHPTLLRQMFKVGRYVASSRLAAITPCPATSRLTPK